ncbi:hypothetical protein L6R52_31645, partial [Myxococcota bacterium]|nr:hypothetical protein [Myxococcota bacterium]
EGTKVGGGLTATRATEALRRRLGALEGCLAGALAAPSASTVSTIVAEVEGKISADGRLRNVRSSGAREAEARCIEKSLGNARMPQPDTGDTRIEFVVRIATAPLE